MDVTIGAVAAHPLFLALVTALLALPTLIYLGARKDKAALLVRVSQMETQLALMTAQVIPISTAFQAILIKQLTHDSTPEMDELLVKVGPPYSLNHDEERRLVTLLAERAELQGTMLTASERHAAAMLPWVIQRVNAETALGIPELTAAAMSAGIMAVEKGKS